MQGDKSTTGVDVSRQGSKKSVIKNKNSRAKTTIRDKSGDVSAISTSPNVKEGERRKNNCVQMLMKPCIMGKFQNKTRLGSGISIQEPHRTEIMKCKKIITKQHPLMIEQPETWNNIPICLTTAVTSILNHIIDSDEVLFDYQMK